MLGSEDWKTQFPGLTAGTPHETDVSHLDVTNWPKGLFGPCQCIGQRTLGPITTTRGNDGTNFDHRTSIYDDPGDVLILEEPGLTFMSHYFDHTNQVADDDPGQSNFDNSNQAVDEVL